MFASLESVVMNHHASTARPVLFPVAGHYLSSVTRAQSDDYCLHIGCVQIVARETYFRGELKLTSGVNVM